MDYEEQVQEALRGVVSRILKKTQKDGLTPPSHYYIAFRTRYPGVNIPGALTEEPLEETTTIILQHQFWDLQVERHQFFVSLLFDGVESRICVPFKSLVSFVDPAVQFRLQFTPLLSGIEYNDDMPVASHGTHDDVPDTCQSPAGPEAQEKSDIADNVISVDFRRK